MVSKVAQPNAVAALLQPGGRVARPPVICKAVASRASSLVNATDTAAAGAPKTDHAVFRTFNGLELDVTGLVEAEHHFITLLARSTAKESQAEADGINKRLAEWQIEVPGYKYQAMFRPLEDLLKKVEPVKPKATKASANKPDEK